MARALTLVVLVSMASPAVAGRSASTVPPWLEPGSGKVKVLTNSDLLDPRLRLLAAALSLGALRPLNPEGLRPARVEPSPAPPSAATPASPADATATPQARIPPDATEPDQEPAAEPPPGHDREWWRERMAKAEERIAKTRQDLEWARQRATSLRMDRVVPTEPKREYDRFADVQRSLSDVGRLEAELEEAEAEPDRIRREARRRGVPPGWLR